MYSKFNNTTTVPALEADSSHRTLRRDVFSNLSLINNAISQFQIWLRSEVSFCSSKNHWSYLRECREEQVLPRTLQHLMASNATGAAWPKHCDAVLEDHIASAYQTKEHKIRHALQCKRNFVVKLTHSSLHKHSFPLKAQLNA